MVKGAGNDTKARIIDAAEEVVLRDGVGRLTLDAAAAEAGLSMGGVLYHFPTRDALVAGMVEKIIQEFDEDIDQRLDGDSGPGSFTRAYIRATMSPSSPAPSGRTGSGRRSSPPRPPSRRCWSHSGRRPTAGNGGSRRTASIRPRPRSCGWPATACGSATCSGWPRRRRTSVPAWARSSND
jgi:AcrR family transcriptional regulator